MKQESIKTTINAKRVIFAISKIGYSTHSAVMDIVDNSVAAKAKKILIDIDVLENRTVSQKGSIKKVSILDDGVGMTDEQILNALKLGSSEDYDTNSLSKYGMGLKSAGFSLGKRITIISKKNNSLSNMFYVDIDEINEDYFISKVIIDLEMKSSYENKISGESGTLIEIVKVHTNTASTNKIINQLKESLGVTYYGFLSKDQEPLEIKVGCNLLTEAVIKPFDVLFENNAIETYDPETYDCLHPCISYDEKINISTNSEIAKIKLKVVLFPKVRMKNYAGFTEDERESIKKYQVGTKYKGFFIYRNGRLIRWGDNLDGIIGRDLLGFRAKLEFYSIHDEILHVDVSKQRLNIPDDILDIIEREVRLSIENSKEIFYKCDEKFLDDDGTEFNRKNIDLAPEDPDSDSRRDDNDPELIKRRNQVIAESESQQDEEVPLEIADITEEPVFKKVRYSDKVKSKYLYEARYDRIYGDYVLINKNHSFYDDVIFRLEEKSPVKQSLEALIWSCASSENLTNINLKEVSSSEIKQVFEKFNKVLSSTVDNWASINRDLFN